MSVIQTCFAAIIFQLWQYNNIIIDIFRCYLIFLYNLGIFFLSFASSKTYIFCTTSFVTHEIIIIVLSLLLFIFLFLLELYTHIWICYQGYYIWVKSLYLSETREECKHVREWVRNIYISCQLTNFRFKDVKGK
jgi:hypothetical protein